MKPIDRLDLGRGIGKRMRPPVTPGKPKPTKPKPRTPIITKGGPNMVETMNRVKGKARMAQPAMPRRKMQATKRKGTR